MSKYKKINLLLFCLLIIFFCLLFSSSVLAEYELETAYPTIDETTPQGGLGNYINYIYIFGLALVCVAAVGALVFGGIVYMTAGSISSADEAKKWIWGAIAGLLLAFCAYLILNTINPDLVNFSNPSFDLNEYQCQSNDNCDAKKCQICDQSNSFHQCSVSCSVCQTCQKSTGCIPLGTGVPCENDKHKKGTCENGSCKTDCKISGWFCSSGECCPGMDCKEKALAGIFNACVPKDPAGRSF